MFSALLLTTDIAQCGRHVRFVLPKAEATSCLFDHLVGAGERRRRHSELDQLCAKTSVLDVGD
jgi:hypothetical protein